MDKKNIHSILYMATFPPRECGIATFTKDLSDAMNKKFNPVLKSEILALNDNSENYKYGNKVKFQIEEDNIENYISVAKRINKSKRIKLVNIQHEFGIFGGENGNYLIPFLEILEKPVVVTLHSLVPQPDDQKKRVVQSIAQRSKAIVVMARNAKLILQQDYGVKDKQIFYIPHGVPQIVFDSTSAKDKIGLQNKKVISTFGMLSRGKGIEYVIKALPSVIKNYPDIVYLVIGKTHPQVKKIEGETYRNRLMRLTKKLGLTDNVKFYNRYLTLDEIITFLKATDIYVSASLDENQIVSGTLSYALSCGKATISTPSIYAKEVLSNDRGVLVKFRDPSSIASAINNLFSNKNLKEKLEKNAYKFSRRMTWPNVAVSYLGVFKKVIRVSEKIGLHKFPEIKLDHLRRLTDYTGIIQHAKHSIATRTTGYTVDDNARALIVAVKYYDLFKDKLSLDLMSTYLAFLQQAQRKDGKMHNLMSYDKHLLDEEGSEDCLGRTIWSCGCVINSSAHENIVQAAKFIMDNALKWCNEIQSPRGIAYTLLGLCQYYKKHKNEDLKDKIKFLSDKLIAMYKKEQSNDWHWFEDSLTYANGVLPECLFYSYDAIGNKKYLLVAEKTLRFLRGISLMKDKFTLIGHNGWFKKNGRRAFYDQQPIEASLLVRAFLAAYKVTKKRSYYDDAILSFNWFLGKNSLNQMVYDEVSGGCFDGLNPTQVNLNQGAESTISYLTARLYLEETISK